ncbi:MAG: ribonuclease P protein component [Candidatus Niyogibacteria bacterium]|nr:ribonuclease P protein component [Candidatus Niyogibacteria bacterium]
MPQTERQGCFFSYLSDREEIFHRLFDGLSENQPRSQQVCLRDFKKGRQKAVARNKLRRRSYSIIRRYLPDLKEGGAIILVFKKGATELSYLELEKNILEIFKKAKLLK